MKVETEEEKNIIYLSLVYYYFKVHWVILR